MTDKTILTVDTDLETEQKIVSVLEAEGYLVFTAKGSEVSAEMAERIRPSLIFLKPTAINIEGFAACKAIHNMEILTNVPIIVLASLKEPMDSRYTTFYGIVDYIKPPLSSENILKKTEKVLGVISSDIQTPSEEVRELVEEESEVAEEMHEIQDEDAVKGDYTVASEIDEIGRTIQFNADFQRGEERKGQREKFSSGEKDIGSVQEATVIMQERPAIQDEYAVDAGNNEMAEETGQINADYRYKEEQESLRESFLNRGKRRRLKKSGLLTPVTFLTAAGAVIIAVFLLYKFYFSMTEVQLSAVIQSPDRIRQQETAVLSPREQQQQEPVVKEEKLSETKKEPSETQTPLPAADPPVAPVYSVQLGAFRNERSAEALTAIYKEKGYKSFTQIGTAADKGTVYRVLIGKFQGRKEALQLAAQVAKKEKIKTTVFSEGLK